MIWQRFSSWPFVDKRKLQSPLQFSAALRVLRGQMCCRCSSSWPSVALRGQKKLQSPLQFSAALRVLRGQMCCRCSSSWPLVGKRSCSRRCSSPRPSVSSVDKCAAVAVLRGPWWTKGSCSRRCSSPRPSVSSVDKGAAVAVLRGPSWTKEVAVAVAVLRGPPCPPWTNVLPLQFFVVLRGQKEVAVAVAVLRGPPCPPWTNVLPLQFFAALRGQKELQSPLQFSAALRVLRGQMCCRCSSSRPSVSSVDKCVAVAVLRGPSWPFVVLRGPSWKKVPPLRPSRTDQIMTLHISVQTNVSEPWLPRRYAAFHFPLSPTPYPLPFLPLRLVCDPASP